MNRVKIKEKTQVSFEGMKRLTMVDEAKEKYREIFLEWGSNLQSVGFTVILCTPAP